MTQKLILPAGTLTQTQRDMLGRLKAITEAVKRGDVLDMAVIARLKAADGATAGSEPTVTSGTISSIDNFYLLTLALFEKAPKCCEHITCPKHRARDAARFELMKLANVHEGPKLEHNIVELARPTLVNGGIH